MPDELAEVARRNTESIIEWGARLEVIQDNLFLRVQILVEQRAALGLEYRGSLQHQRRQLRWTSRQFRRLYCGCSRHYKELRLSRQRFSEHLLNLIPYISLLEADSLSSYDFFGGTVDHFFHQWVALRDVHEEARRARDRNFLSRGELASIRSALE